MIVGLIETYQLTFDDLGFTVSKGKGAGYSGRADSAKLNAKKKAQSTTKKVAVKFRDSSGHTWTGRGIQPAWLKAALAAGQSIDSFLVKK